MPSNAFTNFVFPLARLALIMAYFYICDRTNFFMKESGKIELGCHTENTIVA